MGRILMALVAAGCLLAVSKAKAGEYGSFVLKNPSGNTVHYQVRWGNGEWRSYTPSSNSTRWHAYELDCNGKAPAPYVRFDWILNVKEVTYKTYHIEFYDVDCRAYGKPYVFRHSSCGCYLDLYAQ